MIITSGDKGITIDGEHIPFNSCRATKYEDSVSLISMGNDFRINIDPPSVIADGQSFENAQQLHEYLIQKGFNDGGGNGEWVTQEDFDTVVDGKVDKEVDKGLSSNDYTDEEKDKLAGIEDPSWKGRFPTILALETKYPVGESGWSAYVEAIVEGANIIYTYQWVELANKWDIAHGASNAETIVSVKQKYEANPDTNAYTDAEKAKLATAVVTTQKINGIPLLGDITIKGNDIDELRTGVGLRNYIENGNFFKGKSRWTFGGGDVTLLEVIKDNTFGNIIHVHSNSPTSGVVHFVIGDKMIADQYYTYTIWGRLSPDDTNVEAIGNMAFQGYGIAQAKAITLTKTWQRFSVTQKYTSGNNNPRFYSNSKFQLANLSLVAGQLPVDFVPAPEDYNQYMIVYNRFRAISKWTEGTNAKMEVLNMNSIKLKPVNTAQEARLVANIADNSANSRIAFNVTTVAQVTKLILYTKSLELVADTYVDKVVIEPEPGNELRFVAVITLPINFNGRLEFISTRPNFYNDPVEIVLASDSVAKEVIISKPSFYKTVSSCPWTPNIDDEEERQVNVELRLKALEAAI